MMLCQSMDLRSFWEENLNTMKEFMKKSGRSAGRFSPNVPTSGPHPTKILSNKKRKAIFVVILDVYEWSWLFRSCSWRDGADEFVLWGDCEGEYYFITPGGEFTPFENFTINTGEIKRKKTMSHSYLRAHSVANHPLSQLKSGMLKRLFLSSKKTISKRGMGQNPTDFDFQRG
jgi:hypothetical protein